MDPLDLSGFEVATGREAREARLTVSLSGTNLERAGDYNQRIVLQAIRLARETTRQELPMGAIALALGAADSEATAHG